MPLPESDTLEGALPALGLTLDTQQRGALLAYVELIAKWNRVYNLTAVRNTPDMMSLHLLDSLSVVAPLRRHLGARPAPRLLDVGSGAGLPGVVLAILLPDLQVSCVDTVGKKASFIQQVATELSLRNLRSEHARVERLQTPPFDVVTSRAFASLVDFTQWTRQHLKADGVWMAMKGKHPSEEIAALPSQTNVFHVEQIKVPGLDADRCLVWMRPSINGE